MAVESELRFEQYERLLWRVMARLATQGYFVPPDEARDVIHDFYAEAWKGVTERYEAERNRFSVYLYSAFYRFARRRVLALQNWRARLINSGWFEYQHANLPDPAEVAERQEQLATIHSAIEKLPEKERSVLTDFLSAGGDSERLLAARHGLSRYRLRETLVDALGRISTELANKESETPFDCQVGLALWRDGKTVRDTATLLGTTITQVREIRRRYVESLLQALRGQQVSSMKGHSDTMMTPPLSLLKAAILSADEHLLQQVQKQAEEIHKALQVDEIEFSDDELQALEADPARMAIVFTALSPTEQAPEEERNIAEAIHQIETNEIGEIADAFIAALSTLAPHYRDWDFWFADLGPAPAETQKSLRQQLVVEKTADYAGGLIHYGLTPTVFVEAARGIELLARRLIRSALRPVVAEDRHSEDRHPEDLQRLYRSIRQDHQSGGPPCVEVVPYPFSSENQDAAAIPYELLLAAIRGTPQCPPEAAARLVQWLVEVAAQKPFFFAGYEATPRADGAIRLAQLDAERTDDLVKRWGWTTEESKAAELVAAS